MIKNLLFFILFFAFTGCSFKTPENQWQYSSTNAYNSYVKNFLSDNILIAKGNMQSAVKYAKQSANLKQLSKIYLGECALNISVGNFIVCEKFDLVKELENSKELDSYNLMLQKKLTKTDLIYLPEIYKNYYKYFYKEEYEKAFNFIYSQDKVTSLFILSSLNKEKLTKKQIKLLIEKASYFGYKKLVLYWLKHLEK